MEIIDSYMKYGVFNNIIISKKQRIRYLTSLQADFKYLGYESMDIFKSKVGKKETILGIVGDINKSDYLIMTHYDTPLYSFSQNGHDSFNDDQLRKEAQINYIIPMIIFILTLLLFAMYVLIPSLSNGIFSFLNIMWILITLLMMYFLVKVTQFSGIPQMKNLVRNNSSVVSLLKYAELLNSKDREKVSFVFVDYGCVDYFGYMVLAEIIKHNNKKTILLDNVGNGCIEITKDKSDMLRKKFNNSVFIYGNNCNSEDNKNERSYQKKQITKVLKVLQKEVL